MKNRYCKECASWKPEVAFGTIFDGEQTVWSEVCQDCVDSQVDGLVDEKLGDVAEVQSEGARTLSRRRWQLAEKLLRDLLQDYLRCQATYTNGNRDGPVDWNSLACQAVEGAEALQQALAVGKPILPPYEE